MKLKTINLKRVRQALNCNQDEIAEKLGITTDTWGRYERRGRAPILWYYALAALLRVDNVAKSDNVSTPKEDTQHEKI